MSISAHQDGLLCGAVDEDHGYPARLVGLDEEQAVVNLPR